MKELPNVESYTHIDNARTSWTDAPLQVIHHFLEEIQSARRSKKMM